MFWFTVLVAWCASCFAHGAMTARDKPFYPEATHAHHFEEFKATYNKQYATPEEERYRLEVFKSNLNSINELNAKYNNTVYDITKFSDLTTEELVARYTGLLVDKSSTLRTLPLHNVSSVEVPDSFDWREKKAVTRVKDQGGCGSCWTFGLIGCLESQYAIKYNKLVDFSEQQLVDCDTYDKGCNGGFYKNAVGYMMSKGVMKNEDYPYLGEDDKCKYDAGKVTAHVESFESYTGVDEEKLKELVFTKGPIAISVDAKGMLAYKKGVLQDYEHYHINHAVLLVGYGTAPFYLRTVMCRQGFHNFFIDIPPIHTERFASSFIVRTAKDRTVFPDTYNLGIFKTRVNRHYLGLRVLPSTVSSFPSENGLNYWLIKNSWGHNMGEDGYYKVQRGVMCLGISKKSLDAEIVLLKV